MKNKNTTKINKLVGDINKLFNIIKKEFVKFCKTYCNIDTIKRGHIFVTEKYNIFANHVSSGSVNSVMTVSIVMFGIFIISTTVSSHNLEAAVAQVEIERIQQAAQINIAQIKADAQRDVMKYQVRLEETRAAANPYVVAANQSTAPVNVFIDTSNPAYIIETSDSATESAISTIKVKGRRYSSEQRKLMTIAFNTGKEIGFPETIQSLLLQETRAGAFGDRIGDTNLPIGKRSYGVMQMKVATSRKVLKKYKMLVPKYFPNRKTYKRLRDEEIIIKLIQDDKFNIRLATLNFAMHRKKSRNWSHAVVAYNTGQGAANMIDEPKKHIYYRHILKKLVSEVRPFNTKTNLTL